MMKAAIQKRLQAGYPSNRCMVEQVSKQEVSACFPVNKDDLRAGGMVSGPTIMEFIDVIAYVLVLANVGDEQDAVTVTINIDFINPIPFSDLYATARLIKKGKRLFTLQVEVSSINHKNKLAASSRIIYAVIDNPLLKA